MLKTRVRANAIAILALAALPRAAAANDAIKVVTAPKEFLGQKVTVDCLLAYAQETSPTWCEVYNSSGAEVGTIYVYLINVPGQGDRVRAMQECGDQNPRKNNRERCQVTLTGVVGIQSQKAFLSDPMIEWASK